MTSGEIVADGGTHRVFVYGTLRKGGSNHHRMGWARFVASATVRGRLYRIDWYPGLVLDDDAGPVKGEIYDVSSSQLDELDAYEGGEYRRVTVHPGHGNGNGLERPAWIWEWNLPVDESTRIASGDWFDQPAPPAREREEWE